MTTVKKKKTKEEMKQFFQKEHEKRKYIHRKVQEGKESELVKEGYRFYKVNGGKS